jgi:hypothetical protein
LKELDILDNAVHISRIKEKVYFVLSEIGIEVAKEIRTFRLSKESMGLYGIKDKVPHFVLSISVHSESLKPKYVYVLIDECSLIDPLKEVTLLKWSHSEDRITKNFKEFLSSYSKSNKADVVA